MKILVVDDNPAQLLIVRKQVEVLGHECIVATNGIDAVEAFKREAPGLVLMDVEMPLMNGYDATRAIRTLEREEAWTPVIFLTGMTSDADLTSAIESGGDDYLAKPVRSVVLAAKVKAMARLHQMRIKLDATSRSLQEANLELLRLTTVDGLTGIANRRRFDEALRVEWLRAMRDTTALSLLMIDIDHFKNYNDHYGHLAGDDCLRRVAQTLRDNLSRPADLVARYGGEEFVVLLPLTPLGGAMGISNQLCKAISNLAIPHANSGAADRVTISVGACTVVPETSLTEQSLISHADEQLYRAKHEGRNRTIGSEVLGYVEPRSPQ